MPRGWVEDECVPNIPLSHVIAELLQVDGAVAVLVRLGNQLRHVVPLLTEHQSNPWVGRTYATRIPRGRECPIESRSGEIRTCKKGNERVAVRRRCLAGRYR